MTTVRRCRSCHAGALGVLIDFGTQPPSNRFERPGDAPAETHPLVLGQCTACGLVQLIDPMRAESAKSRFAWLTYNEPEGHLDDLVGRLRGLPGLHAQSRIFGLTYKDDSTLARFNRAGYAATYRYDLAADLGLDDPCAGLESIQQVLDTTLAERLVARHGRADLLLVRHILEHAHQPTAFLAAVRRLVKPDGWLMFEMPDSTKFLRAFDYCFVWEEHITYFTPATLAAFFAHAGAAVESVFAYAYPLEDSLTGIVRNADAATRDAPSAHLAAELADGQAYSRRYADVRARVQALLRGWRAQGERVAVFGAGHLAAKFVNLLDLVGNVDCVIDDNAYKQALLMPGSRLPIRGSATLASGEIRRCLLSLNPESELKVRAKMAPWLAAGGEFRSIFASSPSSVYEAAA
jgi:SAM-dependent methyltransferase